MVTSTETTDKGIGLALVFSALAALGALVLFAAAPAGEAAWGFAAAVTFGTLAVVGIHVYAD